MRVTIYLALIALLAMPHTTPALEPRADKDDLTQEWAAFRRAQVSSVAYDLQFALREGSETFAGRAELHVILNKTDASLSIDLKADAIRAITVNGKPVARWVERKGSFDLPAESLVTGPMTIVVEYTGSYSDARDGLCHYVDPVDQREYLFTNLEPFGAHLVFPCFDQPDIKATYTLQVEAPSDWVLIGNMQPASEAAIGDRTVTRFKPTPSLSTYLFFLGAGEYKVWRDEHHGLPLALYARDSLSAFFDPERLFAETKAGLDYFNAYFGADYPFDKYAHVFAPDLGPGAMENPGAVTMNEYMIFRGRPTNEDYRGRNNTLLHEMAHMWFGDLVTMAWWNDLWLNESFATFSSYQAQDAIGAYTGVWEQFYQAKGWAHYQDQLSTTHPIEVNVPSVQLATANFDGITYAKGASALKQLWYTVGAEAYQRGVAQYFRQYAWQNATRAQFMASIAAETDTPLTDWTRCWLQTEGLSSMAIRYDCENGLMKSVSLAQTPVNAPTRSPHKTQVALFQFNDAGKLVPTDTLPVIYEEADNAIPALEGKPCPDFIYPNYGDMDYGLFFLDDRSFATVSSRLSALDDPFVRRMVWGTLYSMVRHQKLRASGFMELLLDQIPEESNPEMIEYLLGSRPTGQAFQLFLPLETTMEFAPRMDAMLWAGYQNALPGTDARLHWLDAYIDMAVQAEAMTKLRGLLETEGNASPLDQPRRWRVIRQLTSLGATDVEALLAEELERDPTDQGKRYAFSVRGAIPTLEAKRAHWERLKEPELPLSLFNAGAGSFHDRLHPELTAPFVEDWFAYVASRDWDAEQHRIRRSFGDLMPPIYTPEFLARNKAALSTSDLPARARRAWQESIDAMERIVAIRGYDATQKPTQP